MFEKVLIASQGFDADCGLQNSVKMPDYSAEKLKNK
jgi:hypothetical protein